MATSVDQAMQMLDFSSGKLDVQLLDNVVCRFYDGNGQEVSMLKLSHCQLFCIHIHRIWLMSDKLLTIT